MVPRRRRAAMKVVQMLLRKEVFVLVMVPSKRLVVMKDVQMLLRIKEFVFGMARHGKRGLAAMKDVQIML